MDIINDAECTIEDRNDASEQHEQHEDSALSPISEGDDYQPVGRESPSIHGEIVSKPKVRFDGSLPNVLLTKGCQ